MKSFFKKFKYNPYEIADALVIDLINFYELIDFYIKKILGKYSFLKKNVLLKNAHINKRIFLLGNGPSLNAFDIKKMKDEIVIMVNRSFDHPSYEIIKPKYHIIIDSKLADGTWPLEYLDIIYKKNPNVNLLLNAKWYHLEKFSKYRNKDNIFWIKHNSISLIFNNFNSDLSTIYSSGISVTEQGLNLGVYLGCKKIYILGVIIIICIFMILCWGLVFYVVLKCEFCWSSSGSVRRGLTLNLQRRWRHRAAKFSLHSNDQRYL